MKVEICEKCCLCHGSSRALNTSIETSKSHNTKVYKELLHNKRVMNTLDQHGIKQENNIDNFTPSDHVIIRANGEPKSTFKYLDDKGITYTNPNFFAKCFNNLFNYAIASNAIGCK